MRRALDAASLPALKHLLLGDSAKSSTACVSGPQSSLDIQRRFHGLEMVHIGLNCLLEGPPGAGTDMSKTCVSLK